MGVPSFYRWLVRKYPKSVVDAIEDRGGDHVDCCSLPNPNGLEFDNLYLDMNGIIHPCFHPEDDLFPPTTFDEVFLNIYEYIDRLFTIVRPRNLLFLAIDGVAPRAKMNQQRSRRFRTAKDIQVAEQMEDKLRKEFESEGKILFPKEESQISDSNVITPGTEFMYTLSRKLESYIRQRISDCVAWRNIKVILSDANSPGEGEHKIMSFIRAQRALPEYNPNTKHCLYGLDADLIMLALTTHEIHFSIIREDILFQKEQAYHLSAIEHSLQRAETCSLTSRGWFKEHLYQKARCSKSENSALQEECVGTIDRSLKKKTYQFLHVWILREYLALDLEITCLPEKFHYDFENIIDDFILICFLAGNDFLPHIPCLEIHEGGIDLLTHVYKKEFKNLGGYLVDMQRVEDKKCGYIKLKRVERFLLAVGQYEDQIFMKRAQMRDRKLRQILSELTDSKDYDRIDQQYDERTSDFVDSAAVISNKKSQKKDGRDHTIPDSAAVNDDQILKNTNELKQKMKDYLRDQSDLFKDGYLGTDKVKFGTVGWKERYYKEKFSTKSPEEMETMRKDVITKYGEGLCWVLLYYFSGVPSWNWFYPYHHGPPASDFKGLSQTKVKFDKGLPFKPFDQLMGVLPPKSAHALPMAFKRLMTDENSAIIDFYPTEFETDIDGKRFMWQGICKLPFIDENRLLIETKKLEDELKDHEKSRNLQMPDLLLVASSSKLGNQFISHGKTFEEKNNGAIKVDYTQMGIDGTVHPISTDGNHGDECSTDVIAVFYETRQDFQHLPRLLGAVDIPEKIVSNEDIIETKLWHEERGRNTSYCNMFQNPSRPRKPESNMKSHPKSCPLGVVSKGAGSGFMGRGKTSTNVLPIESYYNFPKQARGRAIGGVNPLPHAAREQVGSSSNIWDSRMRCDGPYDINLSKYNFNGRLKHGFYGEGECKDFEGLSITTPVYRPQQHGVTSNNPRQDWSSNKQPIATSLGNRQRGPGQGSYDQGLSLSTPVYRPRQHGVTSNNPRQDWSSNKQPIATSLGNRQRGPGQGSYDQGLSISTPVYRPQQHGVTSNNPRQDWSSNKQSIATSLGNRQRGPGQGSYDQGLSISTTVYRPQQHDVTSNNPRQDWSFIGQ